MILTLVETDLEGAATEVSLEAVSFGLALSAVVGRSSAMSHWAPGTHTSTFLANALNLAAGRAALGVMTRELLWERSATVGMCSSSTKCP